MAKNLIPGDKTIKAIQPGDPRGRLSDGEGLYLLLFIKGGAHGWRFDYTHSGKRKTLSLGTYPDTTLAAARNRADEFRKLVDELESAYDLEQTADDEGILRRLIDGIDLGEDG